jgi:hypothetical protein
VDLGKPASEERDEMLVLRRAHDPRLAQARAAFKSI